MPSLKPQATYDDFALLDIRIGKVVDVQPFPRARNPSYKVGVDVGADQRGRQGDDTHRDEVRDQGHPRREPENPPVGGGRDDGRPTQLYYQPTVVDNVARDTLINRDETFGPIVPVITVSGDDEALAVANDSHLGLQAAV